MGSIGTYSNSHVALPLLGWDGHHDIVFDFHQDVHLYWLYHWLWFKYCLEALPLRCPLWINWLYFWYSCFKFKRNYFENGWFLCLRRYKDSIHYRNFRGCWRWNSSNHYIKNRWMGKKEKYVQLEWNSRCLGASFLGSTNPHTRSAILLYPPAWSRRPHGLRPDRLILLINQSIMTDWKLDTQELKPNLKDVINWN